MRPALRAGTCSAEAKRGHTEKTASRHTKNTRTDCRLTTPSRRLRCRICGHRRVGRRMYVDRNSSTRRLSRLCHRHEQRPSPKGDQVAQPRGSRSSTWRAGNFTWRMPNAVFMTSPIYVANAVSMTSPMMRSATRARRARHIGSQRGGDQAGLRGMSRCTKSWANPPGATRSWSGALRRRRLRRRGRAFTTAAHGEGRQHGHASRRRDRAPIGS